MTSQSVVRRSWEGVMTDISVFFPPEASADPPRFLKICLETVQIGLKYCAKNEETLGAIKYFQKRQLIGDASP